MIFSKEITDSWFKLLESTKEVQQKEKHHPEGDVFNHSLQVLNWAFRESEDTDLIIAAMLHDIGKKFNTLDHDTIGADLVKDVCSAKTQWLIKNHMRIWYLIFGNMKKLSKVKELSQHPWIPELVLLCRWDTLGRDPKIIIKYDKQEIINKLNVCAEKHFKKEK